MIAENDAPEVAFAKGQFVGWLYQNGYRFVRDLGDGRYACLKQFLFTTAIITAGGAIRACMKTAGATTMPSWPWPPWNDGTGRVSLPAGIVIPPLGAAIHLIPSIR